ncbi:MAG: hypothetical protein HAW60_04740 [Bdellovibrionales bacterium]|nr:hypothetical protein [Bdellovibrionales bacterium]
MSLEIYKLIHLISILALIFSFGLMIGHYKNGGEKNKQYNIIHGISITIILISGFGMLARMSIHWPWPTWVIIKALVWIVLGGIIVLFRKKPNSLIGLISILLFGGLAIFSAIYHI